MRPDSLPFLVAPLVALAACASHTPARPASRLAADEARSGEPGSLGPYEVVATSWWAPSRVSEALRVEATIPNGVTMAPIVLFVHGGLVPIARYQWLLDHFASRGYAVLAPEHFADLAVFEADNARSALDDAYVQAARGPLAGVFSPGAPVVVMGHSLGGVVAAWSFFADERVSGLVMLASYPAEGAIVQSGRSVLSVGGRNDARSKPEQVRSGVDGFSEPRSLAFIDGMNHYAWTDAATRAELATDGPLDGDLDEVRARALVVLDAWLDATTRGSDAAARTLAPLLEALP